MEAYYEFWIDNKYIITLKYKANRKVIGARGSEASIVPCWGFLLGGGFSGARLLLASYSDQKTHCMLVIKRKMESKNCQII